MLNIFRRVSLLAVVVTASTLLFAGGSAQAATNGRMIDDSVFDASGSMSATDIQNFLNGFPNSCLKNYTDDMPSADPTRAYFDYSGTGSAAQIIRRVADNYGINPRVLLTKLEQESSLVSGGSGCALWRQASAVGFKCYDGANLRTTVFRGTTIQTCVATDADMGVARQLSRGGWLLKWAKERANGNLNWLVPDDAAYTYNGPMTQGNKKRCGTCSTIYYDGYWNGVYLESGATASLYNYTPYLNQAFDEIWEGWWGAGSTVAKNTNWNFESLDGSNFSVNSNEANVGPHSKTVVLSGIQFVFYYDVTNGDLKLAKEGDSGWSFEVLDGDLTSSGKLNARLGWRPHATIYQNVIHVFYYDIENGNLRHAWSDTNGANWQLETLDGTGGANGRIDANVGQGPSAVVSGADLHIFYYDVTSKDLRHALWSQSQNAWKFEVLDGASGAISRTVADVGYESTATIFGTSLQLFYYDATNGNLRHAWDDGQRGWLFENLDGDPGSIGRYNSHLGRSPEAAIFGSSLQVFYYDVSNGNLRHAWSTNTAGWKFENLDGDNGSVAKFSSNVGLNPSMTIYKNTIQLLYYDVDRGVLRHAFAGPSGWGFEDFDGTSKSLSAYSNNVGLSSTLNVKGDLLSAYYHDASKGDLRHAWFTP